MLGYHLSTCLFTTYLNPYTTYLPTCLDLFVQKMFLVIIYITKLGRNLTNQMIHYVNSQNDQPNSPIVYQSKRTPQSCKIGPNQHLQIDKMVFFTPIQMEFFTRFSSQNNLFL